MLNFSTHGRKHPEKLGQILLNGNNVCMVFAIGVLIVLTG